MATTQPALSTTQTIILEAKKATLQDSHLSRTQKITQKRSVLLAAMGLGFLIKGINLWYTLKSGTLV